MAMVSFTRRSLITAKPQEEHLSLARNKEEDGEIGVFGAEKYFNRGMKDECPSIGAAKQHQQEQYKKEERSDMIQPIKTISTNHHPTPSTRSGSSWNSQSALLRNPSLSKAKKARGKSLLASLSCKCICSDKNSVDVAEEEATSTRSGLVHGKPIPKDHPTKTAIEVPTQPKEVQKMDKLANGHNKESSLSLPDLSTPKVQFQLKDDQEVRKSLEVFGSPVVDKRSKSLNIESRLAELAREANQRMLEEETKFAYNNESGSDASSDLFEIESLRSKPNPFLAVQGSGCVTPTTCYAPSEASIEWSVITASAVDLDFEDQRPKTKSTKQIVQKRHPKTLLSCKSHKSVRVAGDAYIARDKVHDDHSPRTGHISIPITPVTRFQGGNKMTSFDSKQEHGSAKHKFNRSRSPRASHLLYIQ